MKILITKDTMSEIYLDAVKIRHKVFIQEQGVPLEREIDKDEAYSIHFVLYTDEQNAAATVRLLPLNTQELKLQRMAVLKEFRGQKLGDALLQEAELFAKQQGFQQIRLDAQLSAQTFYKAHDYQTYGEAFQEVGIDHIHMKKDL
ncbi:GNAT family N-acetyltransferase [Candidatus Enterococcus ferrettii]|uniref:N-acetyltransferase domain-containing protein n=1 Tax=Candidatus Enterococcus ferrettii TaxID=2815324 RepID=A0ABV0EYW7_9ENTE|nr:GNAT family N-acetyltransferase [Enterococcus sp. 665A]MBO1339887.1 GNAT family N-acetyltransferase [Enterococcus sp. 665A]